MQLTKLIIGQILAIFLVSGFLFFIFDSNAQYQPENLPDDYNASFLRIESVYANISAQMEEVRNQTQSINTQGGIFGTVTDFLGMIFSAGYQAGLAATAAVETINVMIDVAIDETLGTTEYSSLIKGGLMLILITVIVVGILFHFIFKSDRT